jgi:hypothetical protein
MGRRQGAKNRATPARDIRQTAAAFQKLAAHATVNRLQFEAQRHEADVVRLMRGLMSDITVPVDQRIAASKLLATWARGLPKPWFHDGKTIYADDITSSGLTVAQQVAEAERLTAISAEVDRLVAARVPWRDWPADVRAAVEPLMAAAVAEAEAEDKTGVLR